MLNYSNSILLKSAVGFGVFIFISSSVSRMISETARLRYQLRLAGTTYQGACALLHFSMASSKAAE